MARPIWSGTISFGLVSVPVRMFTATQSKEVKFHFLDRRDMAPIGYDKVNKETGESVDPGEIIRGFEFEEGVAIAKVVIRNKQHLAAIRPTGDTLVLETMYYADEVRQPEEAPKPQVRSAEVEMAKTLIENLAAKFDPESYHDCYRNELLELLQKKAEGAPLPEPKAEEGGAVVDLMEALRQSVAATKRRSSRKTSSTKKTTTSRKKTASRKAS